ncbi:MAG: hypothetical protein ACRDYB_13310 [Acidimicrobiales bacterium]
MRGLSADVRRLLPKRTLAATRARDGTWLAGTRDALHLVGPEIEEVTLPWESVESATWNSDEDRLRITEVGEYGEPRRTFAFALDDPGSLLALVRERVTASVVLQRRAEGGLTVVARRPPRGGEITWAYELDPGVDPGDPAVRRAAASALRAAQDEVGMI